LIYAESNELKNYYCPKCGTHIESITEPRGGNCPEGGAHHWRCLGPVGEKLFQCDKCGLIVKSKDYPYGGVNCKKVGGHIWKRIS
jgi:DNA-directed RNA polymerase subunit RPC12/RpoP